VDTKPVITLTPLLAGFTSSTAAPSAVLPIHALTLPVQTGREAGALFPAAVSPAHSAPLALTNAVGVTILKISALVPAGVVGGDVLHAGWVVGLAVAADAHL